MAVSSAGDFGPNRGNVGKNILLRKVDRKLFSENCDTRLF